MAAPPSMTAITTEKDTEMFFEKKKQELICLGKSVNMALDKDDRFLLRVFLGYQNGLGLSRPCKDPDTAPVYLKETLFDPDKEDDLKIKTDIEPCERTVHGKLQTLYPIFRGKWFEQGITFSHAESCALVRSFQTFDRVYATDLCMKRMKPGTRIFIAGPVSFFLFSIFFFPLLGLFFFFFFSYVNY